MAAVKRRMRSLLDRLTVHPIVQYGTTTYRADGTVVVTPEIARD